MTDLLQAAFTALQAAENAPVVAPEYVQARDLTLLYGLLEIAERMGEISKALQEISDYMGMDYPKGDS